MNPVNKDVISSNQDPINSVDWPKKIKDAKSLYTRIEKMATLPSNSSEVSVQFVKSLGNLVVDLQQELSNYEEIKKNIKQLTSQTNLLAKKVEELIQKNMFDEAKRQSDQRFRLLDESQTLCQLKKSFKDALINKHSSFVNEIQKFFALKKAASTNSGPTTLVPANIDLTAPSLIDSGPTTLVPANAGVMSLAPANIDPVDSTEKKTVTELLLGGQDLSKIKLAKFEEGDVWLDDLDLQSKEQMIDLNFMTQPDPLERKNRVSSDLKRGKKNMGVFVEHAGGALIRCDYEDDEKGKKVRGKIFLTKNGIADDTVFAPGELFIKGWKLENRSVKEWTEGSKLASVGEHNNTMGAPNKVQIMDKNSLPAPGRWTIVCQLFKAPEEIGIYMSYWRMHDSKDNPFGERVRVKIRVSA